MTHICQPVLKGKGQLITLLSGNGERRAVGSTVGPHPGTRRFARHLRDFFGDFPHVIADALAELLVSFVTPCRVIVKAAGNSRFAASLWIGRYTVMRSPGMRADLNQRGLA